MTKQELKELRDTVHSLSSRLDALIEKQPQQPKQEPFCGHYVTVGQLKGRFVMRSEGSEVVISFQCTWEKEQKTHSKWVYVEVYRNHTVKVIREGVEGIKVPVASDSNFPDFITQVLRGLAEKGGSGGNFLFTADAQRLLKRIHAEWLGELK